MFTTTVFVGVFSLFLPRNCPLWRGTVSAAGTESWGYPAHLHHTGTGPRIHRCPSLSDHTAPPNPPDAWWRICRGEDVREDRREERQDKERERRGQCIRGWGSTCWGDFALVHIVNLCREVSHYRIMNTLLLGASFPSQNKIYIWLVWKLPPKGANMSVISFK